MFDIVENIFYLEFLPHQTDYVLEISDKNSADKVVRPGFWIYSIYISFTLGWITILHDKHIIIYVLVDALYLVVDINLIDETLYSKNFRSRFC